MCDEGLGIAVLPRSRGDGLVGVERIDMGEVPPSRDTWVGYINMRGADIIRCPYCSTRFRFDPRLTPLDADPPDSVFTDHNAA
jgi:hypothetical protein